MPDSALIATERQLFELTDAASEKIAVRLCFYTLPNVPRSDWAQRHLSRSYSTIEELLISRLDGLIVTGAEPQASDLRDEPYWSKLATVIDWAQDHTLSTIWSCLAVHAAVLHLNGIVRRALDEKCFGVFEQTIITSHPLLNDISTRLRFPHSRWNEIPESSLTSHGYSVLTSSEHAGVDMFVKRAKSVLIFPGSP